MKIVDVFEALKLDLAKKYRKIWNPSFYKDIFMKYPIDQRDRNGFRIYLPYEEDEEKHSVVSKDVENYLKDKGYKVQDYIAGLAKQINGDRIMKIGRLLSKNPTLQQNFANDPSRALSKKTNKLVVISRHPYDVAGMSTDRGWTSCMSLTDGIYKKYIINDVKGGTIVA